MKILQVSNVHYIRGGADKVYFDTADLLANNGHEISYFSTKHQKNQPTYFEKYFVEPINYFEENSINSKISAAFRYLYFKQAADKLDELLKDHLPDIAHLHIFQNQLSNAILPVLQKHGVPTVMSVHEYKMLCPTYTFLDGNGNVCEKCRGSNYMNCIKKKCNKDKLGFSMLAAVESFYRDKFLPYEKFIDHFIMVSDFIRQKHIQYKPAIQNKSSKLYNFLDIKLYQPTEEKGNYYLYFGRLSREKGLRTLLEAFRKFPDLHLKIVGDGAMMEQVVFLKEQYGLVNVDIVGYKSGDELREIIARARFAIVPSEWYETFGLIIIEAMALKTPVLGARIGAIPELINDGQNGFLFEPKNIEDLEKVIAKTIGLSQSNYIQLAYNARSFVESNFLHDKHYHDLLKIYNHVIENYDKD